MTDENRLLAEWMGWDEDPFAPWGNPDGELMKGPSWVMEDGSMILQSNWNPRSDLRQAMMLLGKFVYDLQRLRDGSHLCIIWDEEENQYQSNFCDAPEAAIVEAVKKAIEGE